MVRRSGVRNFKFDIDTGLGSFLPAKDQPADLPAIQAAVKESGFALLWLEAQVHGTLLSTRDGTGAVRPGIRVHGTGQVFVLTEGTTEEERNGYARLEELLAGSSRKVVVRGRVHPHADSPPGLTVRKFRLAE